MFNQEFKAEAKNIKSINSSDHNAVLDFNKAFSKTFMVLFQYLKMTSKTSIPSGFYSSYKSGLFGESKHQAEQFLINNDGEDLEKLSQVKM